MRLDIPDYALPAESGNTVVVPNSLAASQLIQRIQSGDPYQIMPPPPADSDKKLSAEQIGILKRWIASGATWTDHWSFVPIYMAEMATPRETFIKVRGNYDQDGPKVFADRSSNKADIS